MSDFKKYILFILCTFISCSTPTKLPPIFKAKVIAVIDGDTVDVQSTNDSYRIRLADIDCPESDQPFGDEATEFVSSECLSDSVTIENDGEWDPYGRSIATIYIQDIININLNLSREGWLGIISNILKTKIFQMRRMRHEISILCFGRTAMQLRPGIGDTNSVF